ncbi:MULTISPECIES: YncE family protein [Paenibacillaceae]|uniref:YncE family protein n=1 Tax=Paenibacillaceae TaxID=186822 RepID=UPI0001AFCF51|nr:MULTISPECIES: YncE family protein [Paenibacillaceae]EES73386.1 cytochrome D1 heme domain protein [Paenibacillus sp. oral taxon 786 str. D14]
MKNIYRWGGVLLFLLLVAGTWLFVKQPEGKAAPASVFYVPNAGDGTISVVDYEQGKAVDTIKLGTDQASHGIALSLDQKVLYVGTGFDGKTLIAIDTKTKKKIKELAFDEGVHGIDISPDGQNLYVSLNPGLGKTGGKLAIVDTANLNLKSMVETGEGPAHVAVTADGSQVWTANVNDDTISIVDATTAKVVKTIAVGKVPNEVAVMPDSRYAFAANVESNTVSVIDMKTMQVIKDIEAGEAPHGVTVSPDGKELWVSNNKSNDVTVINTDNFRVLATISTGSYANHVGFSPDGVWAFVSNRQSNDIVKINREDRKVVAIIPVGSEPHEISLEDIIVPVQASNVTAPDISPDPSVQEGTLGSAQITVQRLKATDLGNDPNFTDIKAEDFQQNDIYGISLAAHSGDISDLLNEQRISLQGLNGKYVSPSRLVSVSNDSHHPFYLAWFPKTEQASQVEMKIDGPNGETVSLSWSE